MIVQAHVTNLLDIPYERRRFIRIGDEKPLANSFSENYRKFTQDLSSGKGKVATTALAAVAITGAAAAGATVGSLVLTVGAVALTARILRRVTQPTNASDGETPIGFDKILSVSPNSVYNVSFPIGHPIHNTVYAAHPVIARNTVAEQRYYPLCDFHKALFADKYAEAVRLLRTLGASEVDISYVQGWSRNWASSVGINIPMMDSVGVSGGHKHKETTQVIGRWEFQTSNEAPKKPDNLLWFYDEPSWIEVANGRLELKLNAFQLNLNYTKDFGVNARLKAKCVQAGFDLGGEFSGFETTTWVMSGKFPKTR